MFYPQSVGPSGLFGYCLASTSFLPPPTWDTLVLWGPPWTSEYTYQVTQGAGQLFSDFELPWCGEDITFPVHEEIQGPSLHKLFHHDIYKHKKSHLWNLLSIWDSNFPHSLKSPVWRLVLSLRGCKPLKGSTADCSRAGQAWVQPWPRAPYTHSQGNRLSLPQPPRAQSWQEVNVQEMSEKQMGFNSMSTIKQVTHSVLRIP